MNELLWPENDVLPLTFGKVWFEADDKLLFNEFGLDPMVELVELPAMCGDPPPRTP